MKSNYYSGTQKVNDDYLLITYKYFIVKKDYLIILGCKKILTAVKIFLILVNDTFKYCEFVKCENGGKCKLDEPDVF